MAHATVDTTYMYQKGHELKWNRVKAELPLDTVYKNEVGK